MPSLQVVSESIPHKKANVHYAWLDDYAVRAMWKNLELSSDGGDCGRKKWKRGCYSAYGRVWWSLRFVGFWSQEVGFVFLQLAGIWFQ
jgi:hypothetical protein